MDSNIQFIRRAVNGIVNLFDYKTKELSTKHLKQIKSLLRGDDALAAPFVDLLFKFLRRENSDVRLCVLLVIKHFFQRSHRFRQEIVESLKDLSLLTLELDPLHYSLPGPLDAAKDLKREALSTLRSWIEKFGPGYEKLANAERFLSSSKQFDFQQGDATSLAERRRLEKERLEVEAKSKKVVDAISKEFEEQRSEIERVLAECKAATELAYPKFVELNVGGGVTISLGTDALNRAHGYTHSTRDISVPLYPPHRHLVEWTDENMDLLNSLRDSKALIESYLQRVGKWLKVLSKAGRDAGSIFTRELINTKASLVHELNKCRALKVGNRGEGDSSSEEDDGQWIEVEFPENGREQERPTGNEKNGPNGVGTVRNDAVERSPHVEVPTVPYGLDLKYWGCEKLDHPQRVTHQLDSHPFWRPPDDDYINSGGGGPSGSHLIQAYTSRVITFGGERAQIRHQCKARLNGITTVEGKPALCPRKDFHRCPIHGLIVERDNEGIAVRKEDRAEDEAKERLRQQKEGEALRMDIEAATGCYLGSSNRKSKFRASKKANKRDKPESEKRKERLKAKLLNERRLRRVGDSINRANETRACKRFQHQFNYYR